MVLCILFHSCASDGDQLTAVNIPSSVEKLLYPSINNEIVLLVTDCKNGYCLSAFDPKNRTVVWSIEDIYQNLELQYTNIDFYSYKNFIVIPMVNHLIVVDHSSGIILKTIEMEGTVFPNLYGNDEYVYPTIKDEEKISILSYNLIKDTKDTVELFLIGEGETVFSIGPINCPENPSDFYQSFLRYRYSDNKTENHLIRWNPQLGFLDTISLSEPNFLGFGVTRPPIIDPKRPISYWHLTNAMAAFNHETMEVDWFNDLNEISLASRPVLFNNKIIYPTESQQFLVLNKYTGQSIDTIFNIPIFPGRMRVASDKIYFVGGVNGMLYEIYSSEESQNPSNLNLAESSCYPGMSMKHQFIITENYFVFHHENNWVFMEICDFNGL